MVNTAVTVTLGSAVADAVSLTGNVSQGGAETLDSAVATAVANDLAVVSGTQTVSLVSAVAGASAGDISVTFGSDIVTLTEAVAGVVAKDLIALQGERHPLGDAIATAVANNLTVTLEQMVAVMPPAVSSAVAAPLFVTGGGTTGVPASPLEVEGTLFPLLHVRGSIRRLT